MKSYTLVLQLRNKYTYSLETTTIAFQTKGASEPLNIVTTDIQTTEASFSFDQPLHVNGDIVAYQTRCKGPGDELVSEILNINSFSGESVVRNLAPNRRYKCQIRALVTRHHIFGDWSDVVEFVTKRGEICQQILTKNVISSTRQTYNISIGQVMKITGFAIQGLPRFTNFTLKYSTDGDSNDMKNVLDASVMDGVTAEKRVFTTSVEEGNVQRFWFNDDVIEMQIIEFVFENPQPVDFIEVYGCTQFCSSILPSPSNIFDDQTSTMESNTQICSPSLYHLSFESHVTLSGLWMTSLVDEINESNFTLLETETQVQCGETNQIIEVKAEHQETGLMFWFPSKLRCRSIMINKTIGDACFNVSFVGCPSDCTRQLVSEVGLPNINMTLSSGDYGDSTLNNMNGGWVPENGDSERWLEACFPHPVYVTSVALQNAPDVTSRNKITYELTYGFTGFRKNYTDDGTSVIFDGPDTLYEASLQKLPTAITATCLRLKLRNVSVAVRWEIIGCLEGEQPSINQLPQITTPKGQQTSLQCLAQGQPGLNIEWSSQAGQLHKYTSENRDNVFRRFSDFEIIQQSNLTVHSNISYYIRDDSNNVSCVVDMETMTSATADCWLTFSCATFYERGLETSNLTSLVVTGFNASVARPKINETSFKTNTSLLMDWSPGSNTGSDFSIIGYNVTLATKQQDILYQDVHYGVDNQTQFVDNLQPYTVYTLAVSAFNRFRIYSPPAEYDFTTDEAAPSKITNITKEVATNSTLCISWKPPVPANGVLSKYTIEYKKTNTSDVLSVETMENRFVIRELKFDSHYLIRIRASTKENTLYGQWADWISFATLEGRPSQPLNLEFTTTSSSNVSSLLLKGVLSWKPPLHMNGRFQRYVIKFEGFKDYMAVQFTQKSETSQNNPGLSINLDPIYPGTKYRFEVFAVTGGGNGTRAVLEKDIPVAVPGRAVMETKGATMEGQKIEIYQIEQLTGPIAFYNFAIFTLVKGEKSGCFNTEKIQFESNITNPQTAESDGNLPLETVIIRKGITLVMIGEKAFPSKLDGDYEFCVRAVVIDEKTKEHFYGEPASIEIERRDLGIARTSPKRSLDTIQVPIPLGPTDTRYYFVIVNPAIEPLYDPKPSELSGYNEKKPDSAYISGVLTQYQSSYLVGNGKSFTIPDWQRNLRRRSTLTDGERQRSTLLHNDGETGTTYENIALKKGTNYAVLVRAHVDEDTYYSSPWILTNTTSDIVVTPVVTPEDDQTGLIAGVIVAFLLVALLAGAVFFYIRRKNGRRPSKSHLEKAVSLQPLGEDNQSYEGEPINTDFKKPLDVSEPMGAIVEPAKPVVVKPPSKVVINKKYKPIQLMDFSERCEELRKDSHHELSEEYKALHSGQLHDWSEAVIPEIRTKNRYANIVAYNHSRVKLKTLNDINSNYVNASFIHGYRKPNTYIASQGPNQASMNDFWQMIWEQEVSVIVMATNLVEKNKKKCECYWPQKGSIAYGSIVVTVNTMDTYADFVIRSFTLQQNNNKEIRTLQQYHYLSWPDHGVPEFPSDILSLRHKIRKDHPVNMTHSPILVHCSAGVGRTGTFICIDNLLQLAAEENIVDVFNFVNFMRTRRIHMVQTEEQYMFIYKSLLESFTCGITEIDVSRFGNEYQRLLRPNQNGTTKNGFHLQFERLNKVTNDLTEEETASANEAENVNKNRTSILPRDTSRVFLRASIYEEHHGSNYINAIFVNGYKQKDAFIATQHPLESTIIDFWKMVFEKEVSTIVMLNALYEEDQAYETFWPSSEESLVLNEMQVVCLSEDRSNIKETRRFELSHKDNAEKTLHTTLFNYVKWPHDGAPQNPSDIIQLLSSIEATQSENPEKPIIVICSDGAGRSGTFIAISILMEQLKLEHSIDVFQTIKKIRSTRPEFVQNEVRY
ncbi:receptor-type tyrosine-protein phosphatase S-like [Clytia hemisphaerica]|uniref:receptor-type tyrosine-protein phosphatase S-like n=1 Tax=Clytia hemisphaerica TaxID=252671 RepID=UPI0034D658C3